MKKDWKWWIATVLGVLAGMAGAAQNYIDSNMTFNIWQFIYLVIGGGVGWFFKFSKSGE